ncbi:MAG: DNA polymerase I, partial [Duncaniella sp.]|nr:DNA polymerase I [Duncaniella sp.]
LILMPDDKKERARLNAILAPLFESNGPCLASFDIKRLLLLMRLEGITVANRYFDVTVADYVIDPEVRHDPGSIAERSLSMTLSGVVPDAKPGHPKAQLSEAAAMERYCEEADLALRLVSPLDAKVAEREMSALLSDVEFPLIRVLADMEWTGVRIDPTVLADLAERLRLRADALEREAYEIVGGEFNISSPTQVGMVLFERLAIDPKAKRTAKGSYSTTEQVLEKYAPTVPLVGIILKIRRLRKLISTYLEALPELVNPATGKIHTTYNQTVTATGRISSTNPNLQNIPIRTDDGREIRRAFIADPGCSIMSADYSQIELRLIADLADDRNMIDAFLSDEDIHRITASKVYGVPLEEVTDDQRRHAKTANFGIIYGISAFGLSERLGIPRKEAKQLIDGYFATYPHIRDYLTRVVDEARRDGYVTTHMGRRRYLPDINSRNAVVRGYAERNAVNAPVQGSAADIIKVAMVRIAAEIEKRGLKSRMIMQVHDELIFNVVPDEAAELLRLVISGMEGAYQGAVPLEVAAGIAPNWLEAH